MPERILRRPEVETRVGLKRSALYALIQRGQFPSPVRITAKAVGWLEGDVDQWIAGRARAGRSAQYTKPAGNRP